MTPSEVEFLIERDPDGTFIAHAIGHSIVTQGDSIEELHYMVRDAAQCHFDERDRPRAIRLLHCVRAETLEV